MRGRLLNYKEIADGEPGCARLPLGTAKPSDSGETQGRPGRGRRGRRDRGPCARGGPRAPAAPRAREGLQPVRGQPWAELAPWGPCLPCLEGLRFGGGNPRSCFKSGLQNSLRINMKANAFSIKPTPEPPSSPEGLRSGNAIRSATYTRCRLGSHPSHVSQFIGVTGLFYRV